MNEYKNNGKIKVYLAGPFFNDEQLERISFVENKLEEYGFDVFSPRQASKIKPGSTHQDMIDTFEGNISHINDADFVLAILDNNDVGTLFECGYAFSKNIPVLYFNETREKGPNLMLALSGALPFITKTTRLSDVIEEIDDHCSVEPRPVLSDVLCFIDNYGVAATINNTVNLFDEVE